MANGLLEGRDKSAISQREALQGRKGKGRREPAGDGSDTTVADHLVGLGLGLGLV